MKRINAIKKLLREGYTERLLSNLDDSLEYNDTIIYVLLIKSSIF